MFTSKKITQSQFNKLARIVRQEHLGHKFRLTLIENIDGQYVKICYRSFWMDLMIIAVYDRTIYFVKYLQDDTPVVRKATVGINFCKTVFPGISGPSDKYYHCRNSAVDSFFEKYKETILAGRDLGYHNTKTDDNKVGPISDSIFVICGPLGSWQQVNPADYRQSCPFYWDNVYFMSVTINTPIATWVKLFEWYIYDYGQALYIFSSPFDRQYFRVHKENPLAFNEAIDIHLKALLTMGTQKSYDAFVNRYITLTANRPGNAFDFDHGQYSDMIIKAII